MYILIIFYYIFTGDFGLKGLYLNDLLKGAFHPKT